MNATAPNDPDDPYYLVIMSPLIPPSGLDRVDGRNVDHDDAELLRVGRGSQRDEGISYQDNSVVKP